MPQLAGRFSDKRLPPDRTAGFTLIEVLVSLGLVYLLSVLVLNVIMAGAAGVRSSGQQTLACAYGASLLEEMKAHPERCLAWGEFSDSGEASFTASRPEGTEAEVEVTPVESMPQVYRVTIRLYGQQGGHPWEEWLLGFVRIDPATI